MRRFLLAFLLVLLGSCCFAQPTTPPGGGTGTTNPPGGSPGSIQYNLNGTAFGGSPATADANGNINIQNTLNFGIGTPVGTIYSGTDAVTTTQQALFLKPAPGGTRVFVGDSTMGTTGRLNLANAPWIEFASSIGFNWTSGSGVLYRVTSAAQGFNFQNASGAVGTAGTAGQASPLITLSGTAWNGILATPASQSDAWTIQNVTGPATTGAVTSSTLTINHPTGATAPLLVRIVPALPVYQNNAAAVAAGLQPGTLYRNGLDPDQLFIVH